MVWIRLLFRILDCVGFVKALWAGTKDRVVFRPTKCVVVVSPNGYIVWRKIGLRLFVRHTLLFALPASNFGILAWRHVESRWIFRGLFGAFTV